MRERGAVYAMTADRGKKGEAGGGKRVAEKRRECDEEKKVRAAGNARRKAERLILQRQKKAGVDRKSAPAFGEISYERAIKL